MTKVELHCDLVRKLEDADAGAISRAHERLGVERVRIAQSLDSITVEYDASRLSRADVESALLGCGVPVQRAAS